jgi:hypothetical protein
MATAISTALVSELQEVKARFLDTDDDVSAEAIDGALLLVDALRNSGAPSRVCLETLATVLAGEEKRAAEDEGQLGRFAYHEAHSVVAELLSRF